MTTGPRALGALLGVCCLGGCATKFLPAPQEPSRVVPHVVNAPPPPHEGEGQVTLATTSGRARAELVTQRTQVEPYQSGAGFAPRGYNGYAPQTQYTLRPLCLTPCTVNLPLGTHEVLFSDVNMGSGRTSTAFVDVGATPSIVRHTMGRQTSSVGGLVGAIVMGGLGVALSLAGGMLIGFQDASDTSRASLGLAGGITLGIGAGLGVGAVLLGFASRPTVQPGASTQWTP